MPDHTDLLLAVSADHLPDAQRWGLTLAHMAYRIGGGPHLFRATLPLTATGGLMVVDDAGFDGRGDPGPFCKEVLRECSLRGFTGVICDFERPLTLSGRIVADLSALLQRQGWPLYVSERYAQYSDTARVLIPSALSGGTLQGRLEEAADRYGAQRVVLAVERVAEDFYLPAPSGSGTRLTREELRQRMEERAPSVFFSNELCAHYFTYMSGQSGAHFVLFDDGGSIRKKLQVARRLGIRQALLPYPEVADVLGEIVGERKDRA